MQIDEAPEVVGQLGPVLRESARKGVALDIVRVAEMVYTGKPAAEGATVIDEPADADPAETGAVVAALASDQPRTRALPLRALDR